MSTFSSAGFADTLSAPITALQYRDIAGNTLCADVLQTQDGARFAERSTYKKEAETSEAEIAARIKLERADASLEAEQRLRREYEQKLLAARAPLAAALKEFEDQRNDYFARAEAEIVQLALAIAAKILHREAHVDPMLVATLVRLAIEKMREGSSATVRVSPARAASWRCYFAGQPNMAHVEVVEDAQLSDQDCLLETELGFANFGLDSQLKEIERGFFDLLALRPAIR